MKNKREEIHLVIFTNGTCAPSILNHTALKEDTAGHYLVEDGENIDKSILTKEVLIMISEAYYAGYISATEDAKERIDKLLYENSSPRKPKPKISHIIDYREKLKEPE